MNISARIQSFRERLGPLFFIAMRVGDLFNFYLGAFYLPRALQPGELGTVEPITRLVALGSLPLAVLCTVGTKYVNTYMATGAAGRLKHLVRDFGVLGIVASIVFPAILLLTYKGIALRLALADPYILPSMMGLAVLACWQPLLSIIFQGAQRFRASVTVSLLTVFLRVALVLILVPVMHLSGYFNATFISGLISIVVGLWFVKDMVSRRITMESYYPDLQAMSRFAIPVACYMIAVAVQGFIEPFIIKQRLPVMDAAGYYIVCRFAFIPAYFANSINYVLFPLMSHQHERGERSHAYLGQTLAVGMVISLAVALVIGLGAGWLFDLRSDWRAYQSYTPFALRIAITAAADAVISIYAMNEIACRRFRFVIPVAIVTVVEGAMLYGSFGWGVFQTVVPAGLWRAVADHVPNTLNYCINIFILARVVLIVALIWQWTRNRTRIAISSSPVSVV